MKEKVYYLQQDDKLVLPRFRIISRISEHYYPPARRKELVRLRGYIPAVIDEEAGSIVIKKFDPKSPKSHWEVYALKEIPPEAELLEIESTKIEDIMRTYEEFEDSLKRLREESKRFGGPLKKFKSMVDPFESQDEFFRECERVFP